MGVRLLLCVIEESRESCWPGDGRAWEVDGRAQALVGPGLATPLDVRLPGLITCLPISSN